MRWVIDTLLGCPSWLQRSSFHQRTLSAAESAAAAASAASHELEPVGKPVEPVWYPVGRAAWLLGAQLLWLLLWLLQLLWSAARWPLLLLLVFAARWTASDFLFVHLKIKLKIKLKLIKFKIK